MIVEGLLNLLFLPIEGIISLLPSNISLPGWLQDTADMLSKALLFFPVDVWIIVLGNIIFWHVALIAWALIEWVYKKIPGID